MEHSDLTRESGLRALDAALSGGLGKGQLGIVLARHGTGKTPFLVSVALDRLLQGEKVLHVSLTQKVEHLRDYYDLIFEGMARQAKLEDTRFLRLDMERGRRMHCYLGNSFSLDKMKLALGFMEEHASFVPDLIILDDYELARADPAEVKELCRMAELANAELWMSAVRHREEAVTDPDRIPSPAAEFKEAAAVILELRTTTEGVRITVHKPRPVSGGAELPVVLDPTSMLLKQK